MTRQHLKVFVLIMISMTMLIAGGKYAYSENKDDEQPPQEEYRGQGSNNLETETVGSGAKPVAPPPAAVKPSKAPAAQAKPGLGNKTKTNFVVDPKTAEMGNYMEELVDNFEIVLDLSASKLLPYEMQTKLKVCKDVARRMNPKIPERPLTGALRRYGYEAGAFTERTSLLFGMGAYNRQQYAEAIEVAHWSGGKSPLALATDKSSDDFAPAVGYLALVILSDGRILDNDPEAAAQRIKDRYGDRICIYTCQIGETKPLIKGKPYTNQMLLERIAEIGGCGYAINADDVIPDQNMSDWVHDIFTRGHRFKPPKKAVEPLPEPCPDEDGDGVCDQFDKCPNTPRGAQVDRDGCWMLDKVLFDLNKWSIKPEYYQNLDKMAEMLIRNPQTKIDVQGHTCTIWTEEYNMRLSHWRAMSVASYLLKKGVRSDQLIVKGFGYHQPSSSNRTEEGRRMNRRVEFKQIR